MKDTYVRARIHSDLKDKAEEVLADLGFTMSQAITLMLRQTVELGRLPFELPAAPMPNAQTLAALKHTDEHPEELIRHESSRALFESLGI